MHLYLSINLSQCFTFQGVLRFLALPLGKHCDFIKEILGIEE